MIHTKKIIMSIVLLLILITNTYTKAEEVIDSLYSLASSQKTPGVYDRKILDDGFQSLYFDGATYQGKPTRIFSFYKTPEGPGPFPAIVLVHGGGGSAFKAWVQKWNDAGFAAISIATEGQTGTLTGEKKPKWEKNQWGGPSRPGIYNDPDKPLNDQWMNQSVTAAIQAHNLLRSFDEIDHNNIGISGISWGGVITSTVIGFDQRFTFAIPIYGCGFLDTMQNKYGKLLKNNMSYREVWEPALRIANFKQPTFWMTGLKENNFSLDAQANTYKLLTGPHYQSIQPTLKHSHKHGWAPKEPYEFARSVVTKTSNQQALPSFYDHNIVKGATRIKVNQVSESAAQNKNFATLYYTTDKGHTLERKWHELSPLVTIAKDSILLKTEIPPNATAWIYNITINGLTYSSEFYESSKQ